MIGKRGNQNALEPPPLAAEDPNAVEVLRVWATPGHPQQLTLRTTWEDAGAWGLLLVDVARHVALAYAREGRDHGATLARIRQLFDAEWSDLTDEPQDLSRS